MLNYSMIGALVLISWTLRNILLDWLNVDQVLLLLSLCLSKLWQRIIWEIIWSIVNLRLQTCFVDAALRLGFRLIIHNIHCPGKSICDLVRSLDQSIFNLASRSGRADQQRLPQGLRDGAHQVI